MDVIVMTPFSPWSRPLYVAAAILLLCIVAHEAVRRLLMRRWNPSPMLTTMARHGDKPLRCLLPLLGFQLSWQAVPDAAPYVDEVRHVTLVLIIAAMAWFAIAAISGASVALHRTIGGNFDEVSAHRRHVRARWIERGAISAIVVLGASCALMTFPAASHVGASLLASAGVASLAVGMAARPVFSNLLAGVQLAVSQPFRIGDVLTVQGESGSVEDLQPTYVVLRLQDQRRLHVPTHWFIENAFINWDRESAEVLSSVIVWIDYRMPVPVLRQAALRCCQASPQWDGRTCRVQVWDATPQGVEMRIQVSTASPRLGADLCCQLRESLIEFLQQEHPDALPQTRQRVVAAEPASSHRAIEAPGTNGVAAAAPGRLFPLPQSYPPFCPDNAMI